MAWIFSTCHIAFTGQIYEMVLDPFKRLLSALDREGLEGCELHYYGPQSQEALRDLGLTGKVVCHQYLERSALHRVQQSADMLFLPLAFEGPLRALMYTSSVTKFGEYLASGRPVLDPCPCGLIPCLVRKAARVRDGRGRG